MARAFLSSTEVTVAVQAPDRLAAVRRLAPWDTQPVPALDRLTRATAERLGVPVALLTLVDIDRQWLKSAHGLPDPVAGERHTPLAHSLCQYAVAARTALLVGDTANHPQLRAHPAVHDLGVRAYAGNPVFHEGQAIGALCAIDIRVRTWTSDDEQHLAVLAEAASQEIARQVSERQAHRRRAWRDRDGGSATGA
jgi:GAF domain-containing protein